MSPHDSYNMIGAILNVHALVNGFLVEAVADVPESRMTEQPGTIVNHPAWTLAHLNAYAGALLSMLDDPNVSPAAADAEMERYGYGTMPVADRGAYATKRELLERFKERNARLAAVVVERHAEYFQRPSPAKYHPHASTIGHIAITLLVAHPPHHLGQLKQWRRAAGLSGTAQLRGVCLCRAPPLTVFKDASSASLSAMPWARRSRAACSSECCGV
jgi:hypothetical protein